MFGGTPDNFKDRMFSFSSPDHDPSDPTFYPHDPISAGLGTLAEMLRQGGKVPPGMNPFAAMGGHFPQAENSQKEEPNYDEEEPTPKNSKSEKKEEKKPKVKKESVPKKEKKKPSSKACESQVNVWEMLDHLSRKQEFLHF